MKDLKEPDKKFDLGKLQQNYFEASVQNSIQANDTIKSAQNWLLVLGLAEMSFGGAILLKTEEPNIYIGIILVTLLLAFVLFILGSIKQYKHLLRSSRYFGKLAKDTSSKIEEGQQYINIIPSDIKADRSIASDKIANALFFLSFAFIIFSTIALIPFIFVL